MKISNENDLSSSYIENKKFNNYSLSWNFAYFSLKLQACKILNVPVLVTEQNPKALGKTIPQFDITGAKGPFAKTQFSMYTPEVRLF